MNGLDPAVQRSLAEVTTATLTTVLFKKGLRRVAIRGAKPVRPGEARVVGPAFTLRFVPAREDLAQPAAWASPRSTRAAIEEMPAGAVAVADAMGETEAGIFGDILCTRMRVRGVAALVTDGAMRDVAGVAATGFPVWCAAIAAPPSLTALTFVGWNEPIACGGTAILPGDVIVADGDGAIVVPRDLAAAVAAEAVEQERLERWIMSEVERGAEVTGLYPPNAEAMARFEASRR